MDKSILRCSSALSKVLTSSHNKRKYWSLSESFLKEFPHQGFVPFTCENGLSGVALVDDSISPPIRIVQYGSTETPNMVYVKNKLSEATKYREDLAATKQLDIELGSAFRLVNDGGDDLPGLAIDIYNEYALIQTYTACWTNFVSSISKVLLEEWQIGSGRKIKGIYWKKRLRDQPQVVKHYAGEKLQGPFIEIIERCGGFLLDDNTGVGGVDGLETKILVDLNDRNGTKMYLDQRKNRRYLADLLCGPLKTEQPEEGFKLRNAIIKTKKGPEESSQRFHQKYMEEYKKMSRKNLFEDEKKKGDHKKFLNLFAHTGVFSLSIAARGHKVTTTNVDISEDYLDHMKRNFHINNLSMNFHKLAGYDVFSYFEKMEKYRDRYDLVLIDPPSMFRSPRYGLWTSKRHYGDLLEKVAPFVKKGGHVVAFINTKNVREETWLNKLGFGTPMEENPPNTPQTRNKKTEGEKKEGEGEENKDKQATPLDGFQKVYNLTQDVDFRYKEDDERFSRYLKGIVLKKKK